MMFEVILSFPPRSILSSVSSSLQVQYNTIHGLPQNCDGCGCRMTVEHAMQCKKGGLVHIRHDDLGKEFAYLAGCALSHTRVEREPLIHSSVGRRAREVAAEEGEADSTPTPQQQSTSDTDETRGDVGIHGFWERGRQKLSLTFESLTQTAVHIVTKILNRFLLTRRRRRKTSTWTLVTS